MATSDHLLGICFMMSQPIPPDLRHDAHGIGLSCFLFFIFSLQRLFAVRIIRRTQNSIQSPRKCMPEQTNNERNSAAADDVAFVDRPCKGEEQLPLWLFRHNDLIRTMASAEKIEQKKLINILNFIHFKGDQLYILLGDPQYTDEILVKVHAEPCTGEVLTCRWDRSYLSYKLERYRFQYLILSHGQSFVLAPARLIEMNGEGLKMVLPATSLITSKRQDPRFICHDVNAGLWQNGFQAEGTLIDFSPHAFRIRVQSAPDSFFHWFNAEASSTVHLSNGVGVLYSGI